MRSCTGATRSLADVVMIVQVRSGLISAKEAAQQLGISRKTYYKWEKRALAAMVQALNDQSGGRPPIPTDPQKEALLRKNEQLQQKLEVFEQAMAIRQALESPDKKKE